jgi:hypothetical protein
VSGVEPGAEFCLANLPLLDAGQNDGAGEDLAACVVLPGTTGGEGFLARLEPGLAGLELLELGFQ